jgi:integrase
MAGAKKPGSENDRERVLTDRELVEVWQASELLDGDPRRGEPLKTNQYRQDGKIWEPIIKLLILCGARREEIGGLKWSEVNLGGAVLTLTGERTKRQPKDKNKPRLIFLSQKAVEIIGSIPRREGCDYVFSTTGKSPVSGWEKAKTRLERLIAKARIEKGIEEEMPEWRIHDLRRVFAVGFQKLGVRLEVTEQALAHLSGSRSGVTKTYQRYNYEKECREGVELWADHVDEILSGKFEEKIISMKRERAKVS